MNEQLVDEQGRPRTCFNKHCRAALTKADIGYVDIGRMHLCQRCFDAFDRQKMRGRLAALFGQTYPQYTESVCEWIDQGRLARDLARQGACQGEGGRKVWPEKAPWDQA